MGSSRSTRLSEQALRQQSPRKERRQVAAVCYRAGKSGIEFLLVQTRGGRWIFPKGGVEAGLSGAQSAALEAFEEAGVHGRIEEIPFARYFRRERNTSVVNKLRDSADELPSAELAVNAHLCQVLRIEQPQEANRNPTWFSVEKTKLRLLKDRTPAFGAELVRVIDRAASRIRRLHDSTMSHPASHAGSHHVLHARKDALQEVRFESSELIRRRTVASYRRYIGPVRPESESHIIDSGRRPASQLRLKGATLSPPETPQKVRYIDEVITATKNLRKSAANRQR